MPKKLIIGISLAVVVAAAAVFTIVLLRSRALQEEPPPATGTVQTGTPATGGDGRLSSPTTGGSVTAPATPQEGPCGDGVCSGGESWCKPDCGSEEERFMGSIKAAVVTSTSLTIAWQTDGASTGKLSYGLTERLELGTLDSSGSDEVHQVTLRNLRPSTTYFVRVVATEEDGTTHDSGILGFETPL